MVVLAQFTFTFWTFSIIIIRLQEVRIYGKKEHIQAQ